MKLHFSKSFGRPWAKLLLFLAGLLLSPLAVMATDPIYVNYGTINGAPPQVDATTFVNYGIWTNINSGDQPYQTAHTLNYTNEGTMVGSPGWEFDYGPLPPPGGGRSMNYPPFSVPMSANFFNDNLGTIQATESSIANPTFLYGYPVSYLWISATNIVNKGLLIGDGSGEIRLTGSYVDLARSHLKINGFGDNGASRGPSVNISVTNYISSAAIYDEDWGQTNTFPNSTTPYTMDSSTIWNGSGVVSPAFYWNGLCGVSNEPAEINFTPPPAIFADSTNITSSLYMTNVAYTNSLGAPANTNYSFHIFRQAVFVYVTDPNIAVSNRYMSAIDVTNLFQVTTVRLTDSASGEVLYLMDVLPSSWEVNVGGVGGYVEDLSSTNRGLLNNVNYLPGSNPETTCSDQTYRPANYVLGGVDLGSFAYGLHGVGKPAANFLYNPLTFTNAIVPAIYAGYSAYIGNLARDPLGTAVTNLPGRIIINAGSLDLTRTVITNQGAEIVIQANHLISSTGAVVFCQNLSYNLGSTNGNLNVTNLVSSTGVPGLNGTLDAFSALWTNGYSALIPNYVTNTTTGHWDPAPFTNTVEVDLHVLLVDASGLSATVPVTVQDLILNSTNMVVSDPMTVVQTLLFGQSPNVPYSLTLQTNLNLSGNLQNWTYANASHLRYFTNNGVLSIPMAAHFGDDGTTNYASFVNNGVITAGSGETIDSDYFQNSGTLFAPGGVFVTTSNGLVNGSIISGQDVDFSGEAPSGSSGGALELTHATITAGNHLYFNLANALYDAGPASANIITCSNGFSLLSMPLFFGTLMGTTIRSVALNGAEVDHVWAAQDRGATQLGFSNNVVIRKLVLTTNLGSSSEPLFVFSGASANNGLYVSNLDLSGLADFANEIQVNPNLVVYYISVTGPTPLQLSNTFVGSFVQAPGGITPSVGIQPSGPSPKFVANYVVGSGQLQFTVNEAVAGQTYTVEASTNLPSGNWVPIFTTNAPLTGVFQFIIPDTSSYPARFYHIVTNSSVTP